MDKNAIKKYAVWARTELIARVRQRAEKYEITADANPGADSAFGKVLTPVEKMQRQAAIAHVRDKGYEYVIEEVAYTWFNRFAALRYMEVNNYLPSRVRVFSDESGSFKPQILAEAIHLTLNGLDMEKVYILKEQDANEELYKYLLITQCNALSAVLPQMFRPVDERCKEEKNDYTILLFPDNLLREGSVVEQMISLISEDNWLDAVQIIGWLYQYYNSEPKDKVFADLKKNIKITKENIPAATQLFTPDWIVRYMVENSLGRLWLEGHPNDELKSEWKYYLDEAEQESDVQVQLAEIRKEYAALKPEDILCIDPCMGSGHIIVYMFDALMKIYAAYGYSARESVQSIIEHNLYGLDIDDRAAQLAYFSVMMKAVQYDNRFLKRSEIPQPHVYSVKESNHLDSYGVEYFCNGDKKLTSVMHTLIEEMHDASEYGSILNISQVDFAALYTRFNEIESDISMYKEVALNELFPLVKVAQALTQKYDVVITNPPYMGAAGMSTALTNYVKKNYADSKSDLFAIFIEKCSKMTGKLGYQAMITQHAWMFLSSFQKLRVKMQNSDIMNMAHLGARAFEEIGGEVVQTTTFVFRNSNVSNYVSAYARLVDYRSQQAKETAYLEKNNRYYCNAGSFENIPNQVFAYWISPSFLRVFDEKRFSEFGNSCIGMRTGDNARFLRYWYEIAFDKVGLGFHSAKEAQESGKKWFSYCKGGSFRKWYGNNDYVVNWEDDGFEIKENTRKVYPQLGDDLGWKISNEQFYFHKGLTWSGVGASIFGVRSYPDGMIFDSGANSYFVSDEKNYAYFAGLMNTNLINNIIQIINPTINTGCGVIATLPAKIDESMRDEITQLVEENIEISKKDWDSFETSFDFICHPMVRDNVKIADVFHEWEKECIARFNSMKAKEEKLNRIFIDIYSLNAELTPEVDSKDITVYKANAQRDIKSLISYAVGCMLGRYSLDIDGLAYAGGKWDASKYQTFPADKNNIIPICDDEYFEDDITGLFVKFIETVYGKDMLDENLRFIADALGGKGTLKEVIRNYFLNDFFNDHCKMYQKRPIYWLFDSGKKNGFKALVYMHRYQLDTIARMRTDYVHEQQSRYRTAITDLENRIADASTAERVSLTKQLCKLQDQSAEIHTYEEKIHHLADRMIAIDLDDGVKNNYEIFQDVLAKIK